MCQLCASLDGREVWGWMDTHICMTESLHCSPETITLLLIGYTQIQNIFGVKIKIIFFFLKKSPLAASLMLFSAILPIICHSLVPEDPGQPSGRAFTTLNWNPSFIPVQRTFLFLRFTLARCCQPAWRDLSRDGPWEALLNLLFFLSIAFPYLISPSWYPISASSQKWSCS